MKQPARCTFAGLSRYRFLFSRRWILLILTVAIAASTCGFLAQWQLGKNTVRSGENARIEEGMQADPRPVDQLLSPEEPPEKRFQWRPARAHGRYVPDEQLLVRYREHHGRRGFHVLAPLRTDGDTILVVNRGWIPGDPTDPPDPPPTPNGAVTVTGRVRPSESDGDSPVDGQVRTIDIPLISSRWDGPTYGGYVELTEQQPTDGEESPEPVEEPELDPGPFLSYGIQWYIFGGIAVVGLGVLAHDEANGGRLQRRWKIKG